MIGLITSDDSGELYARAMSDLTAMSVVAPVVEDGEATDLPQVHALNSIRAIFITSRLATRSENSIVEAMHLSASCLASNIWAIRNCGLMLSRSLIDRMLGTNESADDFFDKSTGNVSRLSYNKHPGLLELILRLLRSSSVLSIDGAGGHSDAVLPNLTAEAIFPVLDLLRRAPPPERLRQQVFDLVKVALKDASWHVRDMAARSMAALITPETVDGVLQDLLVITPTNNWNELHGRLLCTKHITKTMLRLALDANEVNIDSASTGLTSILSLFDKDGPLLRQCLSSDTDGTVVAAYLDVLNLLGTYLLACNSRQSSRGTAHIPKFIHTSRLLYERLSVQSRQRRGSAILRIALLQCSWISFLLSRLSPRLTPTETDRLPVMCDDDVAGAADVLDTLQPHLVACSPGASLQLLISLSHRCTSTQSRLRSCLFSHIATVISRLPSLNIAECKGLPGSLAQIDVAKYVKEASAPSELNSVLTLWGPVLASRWLQQGKWTTEIVEEIRKWLRLCSAGLSEENVSQRSAIVIDCLLIMAIGVSTKTCRHHILGGATIGTNWGETTASAGSNRVLLRYIQCPCR